MGDAEETTKTPFSFFKKPKTNVTSNLRRQIWDLYIGPGIKSANCPLCGLNKISNYESNGGFEACHIVANKYCNMLNCYYLFPGCTVCNNECSSMCLLDFLWVRFRLKMLKQMISKIFNTFLIENKQDLQPQDQLAHKIIEHLYGEGKFPAGGGVQNTKQIYEIARLVQYEELVTRGEKLAKEMIDNASMMQILMDSKIQMMKLGL
jgi:hypothetical protein